MAQNPVVTFEMADGGIVKAELYPEIAPNTVNNFVSLKSALKPVCLCMFAYAFMFVCVRMDTCRSETALSTCLSLAFFFVEDSHWIGRSEEHTSELQSPA